MSGNYKILQFCSPIWLGYSLLSIY
jgi:hypothetical protein